MCKLTEAVARLTKDIDGCAIDYIAVTINEDGCTAIKKWLMANYRPAEDMSDGLLDNAVCIFATEAEDAGMDHLTPYISIRACESRLGFSQEFLIPEDGYDVAIAEY